MKMIAAVAQTATVMFVYPRHRSQGRSVDAGECWARRPGAGVSRGLYRRLPQGGRLSHLHRRAHARGAPDCNNFTTPPSRSMARKSPKPAQAAGQHRLYVCVGIIERDGGTLYCTAVYLGPEGTVLGHHRSHAHGAGAPGGVGRWLHAASGGHALRQARRRDLLGKLHARAAHAHVPAARGAVLRAHGRRPRQLDQHHAAHRHGGGAVLCSACQHLRRTHAHGRSAQPPARGPRRADARRQLHHRGPLGQVLAGPVYGEDALLMAEIDLDDIPRAQMDFDPVGHYARPDVSSWPSTRRRSRRCARCRAGPGSER